MKQLHFTLVTDGPSDSAMLIPILECLLRLHCSDFAINISHADLLKFREVPKGLTSKIRYALTAYPCDTLFIHRDAENDPPDSRYQEIQNAVMATVKSGMEVPCIGIVPVRMTEAWLLIDIMAIRRASGNPNGNVELSLPSLSRLEDVPDPKRLLHDLLTTASELSGRRRKSFDPKSHIRRIAQLIEDFSPLRKLSAFRRLESDVQQLVAEKGWGSQTIASR